MSIGTIIITLVLVGIVTLVIVGMVRDRKKGKASCCGGCAHCAMAGMCHKTKDDGTRAAIADAASDSLSDLYLLI